MSLQTEPDEQLPGTSSTTPTTSEAKKSGVGSSQLLSSLLQTKTEVQPGLQTTQLASGSPSAKPIKTEPNLEEEVVVMDTFIEVGT